LEKEKEKKRGLGAFVKPEVLISVSICQTKKNKKKMKSGLEDMSVLGNV